MSSKDAWSTWPIPRVRDDTSHLLREANHAKIPHGGICLPWKPLFSGFHVLTSGTRIGLFWARSPWSIAWILTYVVGLSSMRWIMMNDTIQICTLEFGPLLGQPIRLNGERFTIRRSLRGSVIACLFYSYCLAEWWTRTPYAANNIHELRPRAAVYIWWNAMLKDSSRVQVRVSKFLIWSLRSELSAVLLVPALGLTFRSEVDLFHSAQRGRGRLNWILWE